MIRELLIVSIILLSFFALQKLFPREKFSSSGEDIKHDLIWFLINEVGMTYLLAKTGYYLSLLIGQKLSNQLWALELRSFNLYTQIFIFLVLLDFISYWTHRLQHSTRIWEIHKLHHSIESLSPLSSYRHSFLETIYNSIVFITVTSFLDVTPEARNIGFLTFTYICVFQHTNIKVPFSKILSYLFITPDCHVTHHSYTNFKKYGQNFGFIFSIWDRIFGTYQAKEYSEIKLGIKDSPFKENIPKDFLYPLVKSN